jgi:hypothetical protein
MAATRRPIQFDDLDLGDEVEFTLATEGSRTTERGIYRGFRRYVGPTRLIWTAWLDAGDGMFHTMLASQVRRIRILHKAEGIART